LDAATVLSLTARHALADSQPQANGVTLARMINTAQADHGRTGYLPLSELVKDSMFAGLGNDLSVSSNDEGRFRQHIVALTLSEDRRRYQVAIVPEAGCGPAWFTTERGAIYAGQGLGC
jgi:hypothetical protein